MKLRHVRVVVAVAECGTMSAAAAALNVSQPAITRTINLLERKLETKLFRRTPTGVTTTEEGALIARIGKDISLHLSEIEAACGIAPSHDRGCFPSCFTRQAPDHELAALVAIDSARSMRRAAESAGVTQTALARSLAALAARLGRPLYEGKAHRFPSPWIAAAAAAARRTMHDLAEVENALNSIRRRDRAVVRLRIGALPASRVHLVPEAVHRCVVAHQASEVQIVDADYEALLTKLHAAEIDVVVGSMRSSNLPEWVEAEPLFQDHLVVVSHPDHPLQLLPEVDWWDLRSARWVLPSKHTPIRAEFERLLDANSIPAPAQIVEVDSFIAARAFLSSGDWLGIFSASQVVTEEIADRLRRLPMSRIGEGRRVGVLTRRHEDPSWSLERFLIHLRDVAAEVEAALRCDRDGDKSQPKLISGDVN